LTRRARRGEESSGEVAIAIIRYTDEDRQRMREEERRMRLWQEFYWEYMAKHSRVASREPLTTEDLAPLDRMGLLQIDPWRRKNK